jgi:hypothetical protein
VVEADHDVAELAGAVNVVAGAVDREREDIRGCVAAAVLAVELLDLVLVDEDDREVAVLDAGRCERRPGRAAGAVRSLAAYFELNGQGRSARAERSSGARFSAYSL